MRSKELFIFLLYVLDPCQCQLNKHMAGPYEVIIRYVENCMKNGGPDTINMDIKQRKINRSLLALDGNIHFGTSFDDNLTAMVRMDQFTNGGWKENYFTQTFKKVCTMLKKYASKFMKQILNSSNSKHKTCPVPSGNYTLKNGILSIDVPEIPIFFYNKYRYHCELRLKDKPLGCIVSEIDVVPKRSKNKG